MLGIHYSDNFQNKLLIFLLQLTFTLTGEVCAQKVPPSSTKKSPSANEEPVQVSADHVIQGAEKNSIIAWGRVKLKHQDRTLWADKVMVNNKTGIGRARGHVILVTADGTRMKARESLFDLKSKKGKWFKTKGIIANQFHITGKEIERLSANHFILDDATLTEGGIRPTTIRIAVGDEDPKDLLAHLIHAARLAIDPSVPGFSNAFMIPDEVDALVRERYLDAHRKFIDGKSPFASQMTNDEIPMSNDE